MSPTPASSADCRQIKVFRAPNGTLGHRYVDCDNATSPVNAITPAENRFGENDTPVRVAGPTDQKTTQRETTARTMKVGEGADSRGKRGKIKQHREFISSHMCFDSRSSLFLVAFSGFLLLDVT